MAITPPTFRDPFLNEAITEGRQAIEGRIAALDAVSADIRALDDYLERCAVRVKVTVSLGSTKDGDVCWDFAEPDRWRLVYRQGDSFARPLLETSTDVRLRARPALPRLLRILASQLSDTKPDPE
jgi:hypothetical protein